MCYAITVHCQLQLCYVLSSLQVTSSTYLGRITAIEATVENDPLRPLAIEFSSVCDGFTKKNYVFGGRSSHVHAKARYSVLYTRRKCGGVAIVDAIMETCFSFHNARTLQSDHEEKAAQ